MHEFPYDSYELFGIPIGSLEFVSTQAFLGIRNSQEFIVILSDSQEFNGIPWNSREFLVILISS